MEFLGWAAKKEGIPFGLKKSPPHPPSHLLNKQESEKFHTGKEEREPINFQIFARIARRRRMKFHIIGNLQRAVFHFSIFLWEIITKLFFIRGKEDSRHTFTAGTTFMP